MQKGGHIEAFSEIVHRIVGCEGTIEATRSELETVDQTLNIRQIQKDIEVA